MKLYLSSYRIPTPNDLTQLLGRPLASTAVALIPNAKDYYADRAWKFKIGDLVNYMEQLGLSVNVIDLRGYSSPDTLKEKLQGYNLIWAMGGNTYMLRYQMRRSGFDTIIKGLLDSGVAYGGDSAGALVAGLSIAGVESADEPEFAEELITEGLSLVPHVILPHVGSPEFASVVPVFKVVHQGKDIIELSDAQAVIFDGGNHRVVEATAEQASQASGHKPQAELSARLADAAAQVKIGAHYMHYKQQTYKVLALALREEDGKPCVVYRAEYGDKLTWIRPVSDWTEEVVMDGKKMKRFTSTPPTPS